jgi:three-Cys-motif partner protein
MSTDPTCIASDGLAARESGEYSKKKLAFIEYYCSPAIDATATKVRRVYLDLFAGPGLNVIRESGEEVEGGALKVLQSVGRQHPEKSFTHAHMVNIDARDHGALQARISRLVQSGRCMVPPGDVHCHNGDANQLLPQLLATANALDYVLVFADIEAPSQLPWETVANLTGYGHMSVDLYMLFPLEMGLNRLTSYGDIPEKHRVIISRFYGNEDWRPIIEARKTETQSQECRRRLEDLYLSQLRRHWEEAVQVAHVRLVGRQGLYRMLFATNHQAGLDIGKWAKGKADSTDQTDFLRDLDRG